MSERAQGLAGTPSAATILLVDDDPASLAMLEAVLSIDSGWNILTANSGPEALEMLKGDQPEPAAVVLDVHMPLMDGYETAERLKQNEQTRDVPIIFLTGSADASGVGRGYESGAVDYMVKPFDPDILRSKLSVFVDLWEKNQQIRELAELRRLQELAELRREAEERYRMLTNAMPQMAWLTDSDGGLQYLNQRWYDYTGLSREESESGGWLQAAHPTERDEIARRWQDSLRRGTVFEAELRVRRARDDVYRWQLARALPLSDEDGAITGWVGTMTDIDDQKLVEAELNAEYAVARVLAEAETTEVAAPQLLAAVGEALDFPLVAFWVRDGDELRCGDRWATPRYEGELEAMTAKPLPVEETLVGQTFLSGEARWVEDLAKEPLFVRELPKESPLCSWVSFPVVVDDQIIGVIECFSAERRKHNEELLHILAALGTQIGQFIERKTVEEALRASEELKSAILSSSLDCIITIDHRGLVTEWNLAAEVIFGYKSEEAVGREMAELIIPERLRDDHRRGLRRQIETGESTILGRRMEMPALRRDGSEFPAELTITRVDLPNRPPTFTGFLRDITQRKEAEEAILAAERRYRGLVEQLPLATYTVDLSGDNTYISPQIAHIVGYSAKEVKAEDRFWFDTLHPEDRDHVPETWRAWRKTDMDEPFSIEYRLRHRDGHYVWVADQAVPIRDEQGEPLYFQGYVLDVSERKSAEEERARLFEAEQRAREEAERAADRLERLEAVTEVGLSTLTLDELLGELLGRIRELLAADTVAVLLLDENGADLVARAATGLEEEVERGTRIPFGKGFAGRIAASGRPVCLPDIEHADIINPLLREKGLKSLLGVPLKVEEKVTGVIHVGSLTRRDFSAEDTTLLQLAADRVALAIEQRRLFEAEQAAREEAERRQGQLAFLARTSELLSSSLDYELTLNNVAHLVVPQFADWCAVYLLDDRSSIVQIVAAHQDPEQERWAEEYASSYKPSLDAPSGVGRVIKTGKPELVSEITPEMHEAFAGGDPARLEILDKLQMRSYMAVPMSAHGRAMGAMVFIVTDSERRYTEEDLSLAQELARRAGTAIDNARLYRERNLTARTLEDSLLPPSLPRIPGVEVAATYKPAAGRPIGGDFYDLFELEEGSWMAVIGDVVGKGSTAAAMTGLARHTMRTAALYDSDPVKVLEVLNKAIIHGAPEEGQFCTIVCAKLTPEGDRVRVKLADGGHPLPYLVSGERVERIEVTGMPLGMWPELDVGVRELVLEPGAKLVFYTDGVVEARNDGELYGEGRLCDFLEANATLDAPQLAARLELDVITFQHNEVPDDAVPLTNLYDDIAILVVEAGGAEPGHSMLLAAQRGLDVPRVDLRLEPSPRSVATARHALEALSSQLSDSQMATAQLLVSEVVSNAVKYSFGEVDDPAEGYIGFSVEVAQGTLRVEVSDNGLGFAPEFDMASLDAESGRGLFLVDALSSRWGVERGQRNVVWLEILLDDSAPTL